MDSIKFRDNLEGRNQRKLIKLMKLWGWYVKVPGANASMSGWPDLIAGHCKYGMRLIENKHPDYYRLRPSQYWCFTALEQRAVGVWVLQGGEDEDYRLLFKPPNWRHFVKRVPPKPPELMPAPGGPERELQRKIIENLTAMGWFCLPSAGSIWTSGLPDLMVAHLDFGARFLEVKASVKFQVSQMLEFPKMQAAGLPVYVATDSDPEYLRNLMQSDSNLSQFDLTLPDHDAKAIMKEFE